MSQDQARMWADRDYLRHVQYRTDASLVARQSIYAFQQPPTDLPATVLGLVAPRGDETVVDAGCGNGAYLAELGRRGHTGPVLGVDLSTGMLHAAATRAPAARLTAGDAAALPLRDDVADLTLAMHMLYHVPEPLAAVREMRRITRRGGIVLVMLNGDDHLRELRDLIAGSAGGVVVPGERLRLDGGQELLAGEFASVTRHDLTGELAIPGPEPVAAYVRSMMLADPDGAAAAVARQGGPFPLRVRTHCGFLLCS